MKEFWKKHYKKVIAIVIIAAIGVWIVSCVNKTKKAMETLSSLTLNTVETAERRDLVESVSATGKVVSADSRTITSTATGVKVTSVNVKVGDRVSVDDIICVLDSSDLEKNLENANKTLESSERSTELSLNSAKRGINETKEDEKIALQRLDEQIEDNRKDLEEAEKDRDDYGKLYSDYIKYKDAETKTNASLQAQLLAANELMENAAATVSSGDATAFLAAKEAVDGLQKAIEASNIKLTHYTTQASTYLAKCDALDARIDSLKAAYDTLLRNRQDTKRSYDNTLNMKNDTLKSAQNSASLTGVNENKQIDAYKEQIDNCVVRSTISGIVTSLNVEEGDRYAGTPIAVIENVDSYEVLADIDEYDIGKIKLGQRVVIKTNGTGDEKLEGTVKEISPRATLGSPTVKYNIKVSVDSENDMLRMDMTAKISIIIEETKQALTVPYTAVQEDNNGYYVQVVCDAAVADSTELTLTGVSVSSRKVYVNKGIESDYYIEILTDEIPDGAEIVVPPDGEIDYSQLGLTIMGGM